MDGKTLARIGAVIFVPVAITATVVEMNRPADQSAGVVVRDLPPMTRDPLDAELSRCSGIGDAGGRDQACLKAWANNRRRFLGQPAPAASSAPPTPITLFPSASPPAEPGRSNVQPEPAQTGAR